MKIPQKDLMVAVVKKNALIFRISHQYFKTLVPGERIANRLLDLHLTLTLSYGKILLIFFM